MSDTTHPFAQRDALNPVCPTCGKSRYKTVLPVNRRGNWNHDASVTTVKCVGETCECAVKPESVPLPEEPAKVQDVFGFFMRPLADQAGTPNA